MSLAAAQAVQVARGQPRASSGSPGAWFGANANARSTVVCTTAYTTSGSRSRIALPTPLHRTFRESVAENRPDEACATSPTFSERRENRYALPVTRFPTWIAAAAALAGCGPPHSAYLRTDETPEERAWEVNHAAESAGRIDEAIAGYRGQCDAKPSYARACYDLARALLDAGRDAEGREAAARFIAEHPSNTLVQAAASHLSRSYEEAGEAAAGAVALGELAARIRGKDGWDSVQHEIARLQRIAGNAEAEAEALHAIVARGRWNSQVWDDAIWRLIELAAARGDRAGEAALLEQLIATREPSHLIGSYNSQYHDDALLRLGRLYLDDGRLDRAYDLFMELARWETSRKRDDGYYWAAVVRVRQGKGGAACDLLRTLLEKEPGSSAEREAIELMGQERCGGVPKGEGKGQ